MMPAQNGSSRCEDTRRMQDVETVFSVVYLGAIVAFGLQ